MNQVRGYRIVDISIGYDASAHLLMIQILLF